MGKEYFLGLDIGTDSVGYAVTNCDYSLRKFNEKAMWGIQSFDSAQQAEERRVYRTSRRRIQRKKQRINLIRELFSLEIAKTDINFYKRLNESFFYAEDKTLNSSYCVFDDVDFSDKNYHDKYPTIHHLIMELIENPEPHDVRLIYLAVSYIISHREHFLLDVDKEKIDEVLSFKCVYDKFMASFLDEKPWNLSDISKLEAVFKECHGVKRTEEALKALLFTTIKPTKSSYEIIRALSGREFLLSVMFDNDDYIKLENNKLCFIKADVDDKLETLIAEIGDDSEKLLSLKAVYDWSVIARIMNNKDEVYISKAKIAEYDKHHNDLLLLKRFVKKYTPQKYNKIFRISDNKIANYVAYSGNVKSLIKGSSADLNKVSVEVFSNYIKSIFKNVIVDETDKIIFGNMIDELNANIFLPKQKKSDNRLIPYQLYWYELKSILDNAQKYLLFLNSTDESGLTVSQKILSVFEFRIPYYVGPLNKFQNKNAWIERKALGKIFPWNFNEMVNYEKSEEEFIKRMTSKCTYLAGEDVLPKNSVIYSKFMILNEINKIKTDAKPISVELKQRVFKELFVHKKLLFLKKLLKTGLELTV